MNDDIEARLRASLAARAGTVEPTTGAEVVPALQARADAARRHVARQRVLLSVAAVVLVVAAVTGAVAILGGDDRAQLSTEGTSTTATTAGSSTTIARVVPGLADQPVIWPLPTMSLTYADPEEAVAGFLQGYLGAQGVNECAPGIDPFDGGADVTWDCNYDGTVRLRDDGARGWSVLGMESDSVGLTFPDAGATLTGPVVVDTAGGPSVELALRALGYVDDLATAVLPSGGGSVALGPADLASGDYVVVARSGSSVVVRLVHVTQSATTTATTEPTTTTSAPTTTTTEAPDDGRVGWPGTSVGGFDDPTTAAVTFADQVLGFAQTTVVSSGGENDLFVTLTSRPGAGAQTTIQVHDTGARGWIVVGASSNQGRIDTPTPGDQVASPVQVTGVATAFEAQLSVRLLSLSGEVRGQTTTFAGANGEQGPYDTTVAGSIDGPTFVLIGDADASGEGDLSWAAVVLVMV